MALQPLKYNFLLLNFQIAALRNRSAFEITDTELKLIAAAAIIGLSRSPNNG